MTQLELLEHCFNHFFHLDHSNAAIHCATVRYSPITFRLAEEVTRHAKTDHHDVTAEVMIVLNHRGKYEEDSGR